MHYIEEPEVERRRVGRDAKEGSNKANRRDRKKQAI
jgi:hypothetical protein